jgi:hypothetical protein
MFVFLWVLWLLVRGTLINQAGGGRVTAMVKAQVTETRLTSLLNNGGSFGGDIHVTGKHYASRAYVNGYELTMNHGRPSKQGGAPGSYDAVYLSALALEASNTIDGCSSSGIFA